jgi:hypothetical protein
MVGPFLMSTIGDGALTAKAPLETIRKMSFGVLAVDSSLGGFLLGVVRRE